MNYWDTVRPTYVENWNSRLLNVSIVTVHWPLTKAQMQAIVNAIGQEGDVDEQALSGLADEIDRRLPAFQGKAFLRLGSRSPKDVWSFDRKLPPLCVDSGAYAIQLLAGSESERVWEDLRLALTHDYAAHLVLREWVDLAEWQEFRCFVKARKLVGVSQYFYRSTYPEVVTDHGAIIWAIRQWFDVDGILPLLPADDCVVDVFVTVRQHGNGRQWSVRLLEVNPFFEFTDPCLFDWNKDRFEAQVFRYVGVDGNVVEAVLA